MQLYDELKARGLIAQVTNEEEISEMINNGKATFYIGFDPTADSLHVGHFMALCLMKRMQIRGVERAFLTLHAGLGNFRTVDVEDLSKHKMDSEQYIVDDATAASVNRAKRNGRKVVSIGTTVMRTLETVVSTNGTINAGEGWTNKFIFSPYEFTVADAMVSNFHLPYSTQLMMVAAFGGYDCVMNAYKIAREEGYRFGTYGDAMLLL